MSYQRPLPPRMVWFPMFAVGVVLAGASLQPHLPTTHSPPPVLTPAPGSARGAAAAPIVFGRDIRPLLSDRCFGCHGPDPAKRAANLRLDLAESATGPMPNHRDQRAIIPGHPESSALIQRITSQDPGKVMPPPASHLHLSDEEKALLTRWIADGARYEPHVTYRPLTQPAVPAIRHADWARNDIDRFILARLEEQGLTPSPEADKAALLRRVSLDLTGLPPTPTELDAFLADPSADAYDKQVDRLLASPRYGEHLATWWLDLARYADSHGFQSDPERFMWLWRDGVIHAFNANQPFDQFTIEQLAGDLLPNATKAQIIATGFNRNHRINSELGAIDEEWRIENVLDRAETTSAVWLGLTINCARCHDHKYDPLPQVDYYRFAAFFNNVDEKGVDVAMNSGGNTPPIERSGPPEPIAALAAADQAITATSAAVERARQANHDAEIAAWTTAGAVLPTTPEPIGRAALAGDLTTTHAGLAAVARSTAAPAWTTRDHVTGLLLSDRQAGVQLTGLPPSSAMSVSLLLRRDGQARTTTAAPLLTWLGGDGRRLELHLHADRTLAVTVWAAGQQRTWGTKMDPLADQRWTTLCLTWDGSANASAVDLWTDGLQRDTTAKATAPQNTPTPEAAAGTLLLGAGGKRDGPAVVISDLRWFSQHLDEHDGAVAALRPRVERIRALAADQRTAEDRQYLTQAWRYAFTDLRPQELRLENLRAERERMNREIPSVMVMRDDKPRTMHVLERGQYDHPKQEVAPGTPAFLPPLPKDTAANRLALAKWLVNGNPLTARVVANRLWERLFGTGIIATSENLGLQSAWPSHPELLDHLAWGLEHDGWNLKAFFKRIVTSATYRQASAVRQDAVAVDPDNRLLWRSPHLRLTAEAIRDQALAVSGLLVEQLGGPSVKPYLPADLWAGNRFGNLGTYEPSPGDQVWRRSLYTFIKRTAPPTNAVLFDMPAREYCTIKRSRTNTPLQALTLQNDPTYLEAARVLGQRMLNDGGATTETRVAWLFRRILVRSATPAEVNVLTNTWNRAHEHFITPEGKAAAADLIKQGRSPVEKTLDPADVAAALLVASTILNLDEAVTKP